MDNIVFVDLDETLIHTMSEPIGLASRIKRYEVRLAQAVDEDAARTAQEVLNTALRTQATWNTAYPFPEYGDNARVAVRPGAAEGLEALDGLGDVMLFTAASQEYAEQALRRAGLRHLLRSVYSLKEVYEMPWAYNRLRVLLDDTPAEMKLRALGVPPDQSAYFLVNVQPFTGGCAVEPLTAYVPKAHRKLLSQQVPSV